MASTSKGKFCSAMLYKIKVFVFSFSLGSNHKTNVISEKKKCSREHVESKMLYMFISI